MTPMLIAEEGLLKGLVVSFEDGEEWILGRDPDLASVLLEDPRASRKHARFFIEDEQLFVENLSRTNPVQLNGSALEESHLLEDGDVLKIGSGTFRFFNRSSPTLISQREEVAEQDSYETIYQVEEPQTAQIDFDLSGAGRFLIKVVSGPNAGAEFSLDEGEGVTIGTDAASCDLVFHDLSVSRQHARLEIDEEGAISLEDLGSRNGVLVDQEKIEGRVPLALNNFVSLGTSIFVVIDKEQPSETIVSAPPPARPVEPPKPEVLEEEDLQEDEKESEEEVQEVVEENEKTFFFSRNKRIFVLLVLGWLFLVTVVGLSLFRAEPIHVEEGERHTDKELDQALKDFPEVSWTFNPTTGNLLLLGHVLTPSDKTQLLYNLGNVGFLASIDDNVVVDLLVWQEVNQILSHRTAWQGVSMHSPQAGVFILSGYVQSVNDATSLADYMNQNFNYVDLMENKVMVVESIVKEAVGDLRAQGVSSVRVQMANGEILLSGYIGQEQKDGFEKAVSSIKGTPGVRSVKDYVVVTQEDKAIIDLSSKYRVTGYTSVDNLNLSVVINGQILARGDQLDGMTITSIKPSTILLEKSGVQYKIDYNE